MENTLVLAKSKAFAQIRSMRASVLGIGTELTTGQIVNKNAPWISAQLKKQGLLTVLHTVVPDNHTLIFQSLDNCAQNSDLIFITGGLGPTSDDFTRDIIAQWAQKKTFFHEPSWEHVQSRLRSRGFVVRDFQKQQCYYPEDSLVLVNPQGTANGFYLQTRHKHLFVLPGPPSEIEAIWNHYIHEWLITNTAHLDRVITNSWDTIGVGESDVAHIVENILSGSSIEKGYRVHLPYVEFKMSYLQSQAEENKELVTQVDTELAPYTLVRDGKDLAAMVAEKLTATDQFLLVDKLTSAHLLNRLNPFMRQILLHCKLTFSCDATLMQVFGTTPNYLFLHPLENNQMHLQLKWENAALIDKVFPSPFASELMAARRPQYFAEIALAEMARQ